MPGFSCTCLFVLWGGINWKTRSRNRRSRITRGRGRGARAHRTYHELVSVSWTLQSAYQNYSNEGCAFFKAPLSFSLRSAEKTIKKKKRKRKLSERLDFCVRVVLYRVFHTKLTTQLSLYDFIRDFFFLLIFTTLYSSNLARISFQRCRRRYAGRIREKRALIASTFASVLREQQQQSRNNIVTCPRGCSYGGELSHDSRKTKLVVSLSAR